MGKFLGKDSDENLDKKHRMNFCKYFDKYLQVFSDLFSYHVR